MGPHENDTSVVPFYVVRFIHGL